MPGLVFRLRTPRIDAAKRDAGPFLRVDLPMSTQPTFDDSLFISPSLEERSGELSLVEKALHSLADAVSRRVSAVITLWLAVVFIAMVGYSRQKPLWADEVIFRWIATLPSIHQNLAGAHPGTQHRSAFGSPANSRSH